MYTNFGPYLTSYGTAVESKICVRAVHSKMTASATMTTIPWPYGFMLCAAATEGPNVGFGVEFPLNWAPQGTMFARYCTSF